MVTLAVVVAVGPPVGLGLLVRRLQEVPIQIEPDIGAQYATPTLVSDKRDRPVTILLEIEQGRELTAPTWAGLIQEILVPAPGDIKSGDPIVIIDGVTRIALHTERPMFRSLQRGSTGPDVRALQEALSALGYDVEVDGIYSTSTRNAVRTLEADLGVPTPSGVFAPDLVIWLPTPTVEVVSMNLRVGEPAPSMGSPITVGPRVPVRALVLEGGNPIEVESLNLYVPSTQTDLGPVAGSELTPDQIRLLAESDLSLAEMEGQAGFVELSAVIRPSEPEERWVVPVSAVVGSTTDPELRCVHIKDGNGHRVMSVTVDSGSFGWVAVSPAPPPTAEILTNPLDVLDEPGCG